MTMPGCIQQSDRPSDRPCCRPCVRAPATGRRVSDRSAGVEGMDKAALAEFLTRGGPALWVIAALSVLTAALILWKFWDLARLGAWSRGPSEAAVAAWRAGESDAALTRLSSRRGLRARVSRRAMETRLGDMPEAAAREETQRVGKLALMEARRGLRALELIATISPLIGLLGTVLGMIEAFQALQAAG
ncbi:MAG: MotA/TolQ/ExbB proton channel family protein, partial [Natronohydrobacter sp.]|nr:MotA/TolQ/ExbB proton channel family protein [Natronohydrobacter sp.]